MVLGSGIRDPRSGIRKKPIPDPGSRIQGSKSTQSRIPDPGSGSATLHVTIFREMKAVGLWCPRLCQLCETIGEKISYRFQRTTVSYYQLLLK